MTYEEIIGKTSGIIVTAGIVPYAWRVWRREIKPNRVSWFIWLVAVIALLLNYKTSGAKDNIWPAYFSCFNVVLILAISMIRGEHRNLLWYDWCCLSLGLLAVTAWVVFKTPFLLAEVEAYSGKLGTEKELAAYALCVGILADAFGAVPTFLDLREKPWEDRPFAWLTYAFGYGLAIFAITEHQFSNYVLPVYMTTMALVIAYPIVRYRIEKNIPLKEWI